VLRSHDRARIAGLDEVDRREATTTAAHLQRERKAVQTGVDRQRTQPHLPRAKHPTPVVAHLAQDDELLLVEAGDRGPRANVGQRLGERPLALTAAGLSDS
jgi:hypothetical protein